MADAVTGLEFPTSAVFLPDRRMLISERPGRLRIAGADGRLGAPIAGVPPVGGGEGGLLDVVLDPDFQHSRTIYISYSELDTAGEAGTTVASARLTGNGLANVQVIYRQQPKLRTSVNFGSRIVARSDGTLWITQGDLARPQHVQGLSSLAGKIVRINRDGSVPRDNPFAGRAEIRPEIWSYGHRNVQAAALHPQTGELWTVEHGARGGDELNRPERGKNYGWPAISYGVNYDGSPIGQGLTAQAGMEQPVYYWDPVIAPSGMTFYTADAIPAFKGSLLISSLRGGIVQLIMQNGRVVRETRYLAEAVGRTRQVVQGPDGFVYLLLDQRDARIVRLQP
jgi:glucose/arabinose dehydrogenase